MAEWVFKQGAADFAAMSNLPAALREQLAGEYQILMGKVALRSDATDGTVKLLLEWPDGKRIETVLIPSGQRATACVSTQVGCALGCAFCASGLHGMERNLSAGEIVEQMLAKGYWTTGGKTPAGTIYAAMLREAATKGSASRFAKVDRGQWSVTEAAKQAK